MLLVAGPTILLVVTHSLHEGKRAILPTAAVETTVMRRA
jgi:threonine/homoserine/homoserine lactone efflux protein